jgi:hypothetical protein
MQVDFVQLMRSCRRSVAARHDVRDGTFTANACPPARMSGSTSCTAGQSVAASVSIGEGCQRADRRTCAGEYAEHPGHVCSDLLSGPRAVASTATRKADTRRRRRTAFQVGSELLLMAHMTKDNSERAPAQAARGAAKRGVSEDGVTGPLARLRAKNRRAQAKYRGRLRV